jgi:hypothetical protein
MSREEMKKEGICFTCGEKGHIVKECPKKEKDEPTPESNSIRISMDSGKTNIPVIPMINIINGDVRPPTMFEYIKINDVRSNTLFNTDGSYDCVGTHFTATHFTATNKISTKPYEIPFSIRQAIQEPKAKHNATAVVDVKFGEWIRKSPAYVPRLAGYDAIIGIPTMTDGDAFTSVKERKIYFRQRDFIVECTVPEAPPKRPTFDRDWRRRDQKPKRPTNVAKSINKATGTNHVVAMPISVDKVSSEDTSTEGSTTT